MQSILKFLSCGSSKQLSNDNVTFSYGACKRVNIQNKIPTNSPNVDFIIEEDVWLNKACGHEMDLLTGKKSCKCCVLAHEENMKANTKVGQVGNMLIMAFLHAYNNHEDIVLSPDDIWLTILLEFSSYVNKHAERLRSKFVLHSGQEHLKVDSNFELDEARWDEFFDMMLVSIANSTVENVVESLTANFSTTGRIEKMLSSATIMDSFKQYFTYQRYICSCGIRNVYFMGNREDWLNLIEKFENLRQYDIDGKLADYIDELTIILRKFLDTYDGIIDTPWWNTVMDYRNEVIGSGSDTAYMISGWILKFTLQYCKSIVIDSELLFGKYINVPVKLVNEDTGITKMVNVVGGFGGVNCQNRAYRPQMSLSVLVLNNNNHNDNVN